MKFKFKHFILNNKYFTFCVFLIMLICSFIILQNTSVISVFSSAVKRKLPIYCVETDKKQVSISFDAAWENGKGGTLILLGFRIL